MDDYEADATLSASEVEDTAMEVNDELPFEDLSPSQDLQP